MNLTLGAILGDAVLGGLAIACGIIVLLLLIDGAQRLTKRRRGQMRRQEGRRNFWGYE